MRQPSRFAAAFRSATMRTIALPLVSMILLLGCGLSTDREAEADRQAESLSGADGADSGAETAAQAELERQLAEREALVEQRERQLELQEELSRRERLLADRERELEAREQQTRTRSENVARQLADAEQKLAEIEAAERRVADEWQKLERYEQQRQQREREREELERERARQGAEPEPAEPADRTPPGAAERLRAGMTFQVEIQETLSSRDSQTGDIFSTRTIGDVYDTDGTLVVPEGSELQGFVVDARPLRKVGGRATLALEFNRLILESGEVIDLRASFVELGEDQKRDKKKIGGAAIAGAILGGLLGDEDAALVGAAVGAAAGTAAVLRTKGREVEVPEGSIVTLELEEVVTVSTRYGRVVDEG